MPSKYDPLRTFLEKSATSSLVLSFQQVEQIVGFALPDSARTHRAWWANEESPESRHVHARAWMSSGWSVTPNLQAETVVFQKG